MKKLVIIIFCLFSLIQAAQGKIDTNTFSNINEKSREGSFTHFPQKAIDILLKYDNWQTASGLSVPGLVPLIMSNRRWNLDTSKSKIVFNEETQLSLRYDCSTNVPIRWESASINISETLNLNDFMIAVSHCDAKESQPFNLIFLDDERFVIEPIGPGIATLFFPAKTTKKRKEKNLLDSVHIYTAPLGLSELPKDKISIGLPKTDYLHHDLDRGMPVFLDQSFPNKYIDTLKNSILKWNQVFGRNFFQLRPMKSVLNVYDCLSSRKLCFFWDGPTDISFLGASGLAGHTFDPKSGKILGGYIGLKGNADEMTPQAPLTPEVRRFISEKSSIENVAKLFAARNSLASFLHPKPNWQIGYVISHELGHFNGLRHNFYGSVNGGDKNKSDSVMDYYSFSAVDSKAYEIKKLDFEVLALVYKRIEPSSEYMYCSDRDSSQKGVSKDPNCNIFDLGRPDNWFITRAEIASKGVFESHPRFDGILLDYLGAFLQKDKPTVSLQQVFNVQDYLCTNYSDDQRVFEHLKFNSSVELICNKQ